MQVSAAIRCKAKLDKKKITQFPEYENNKIN